MPLSVVGLTVLFAVGVMVLTGKDMDLISNVLPTILMVIGIADVIHLLTNYLNRRREEKSRTKALMSSIREVGFATLLTTVTTMIGFLTLLNSNVQPVIDLGIYACIGLVIAFGLTYTWFPAILMWHKKIVPPSEKRNRDFWKLQLIGIYRLVTKRKVEILVGSAILLGIGIWGTSKIVKNNYILEDLKSDHSQVRDYRFFEENFAGARPFEMALWIKDTQRSVFDAEVLAEIGKIDQYLKDEYGVGALVSPVVLVKNTNKVLHGGKDKYYSVPKNPKKLARLEKDIVRYQKQMDLGRYINLETGQMRLSGNIPDWGSLLIKGKNDSLDQFMAQEVNLDLLGYRVTGSATLVDINTQFVSSNVVEGLFLAFVLIGILVGFLFRSVKMALISLVPNVLPLLLTGAIMGFAGIDLKLSTSIIFIISFGIAVDDSIHFLSRLRFELSRPNATLRWALKKTYLETGKAITITTLILSGGFLTLCFSDFLGTFYIGILISLTLFSAWILDLLLLPALILVFYPEKKKA
ncbi:MMPL family transporter [bacterium SCSIO 12741]|nr:MMPL family transporter [bacterium SCSIO 12741]